MEERVSKRAQILGQKMFVVLLILALSISQARTESIT